jgi:hypothetical protein
MQTFKKYLAIVLAAAFGMGLMLLAVRAVTDYQDFLKMRAWVAQMQALQAEQAKQQAPARAVQAPAPEAK